MGRQVLTAADLLQLTITTADADRTKMKTQYLSSELLRSLPDSK